MLIYVLCNHFCFFPTLQTKQGKNLNLIYVEVDNTSTMTELSWSGFNSYKPL